jgi:hypothetical protein
VNHIDFPKEMSDLGPPRRSLNCVVNIDAMPGQGAVSGSSGRYAFFAITKASRAAFGEFTVSSFLFGDELND